MVQMNGFNPDDHDDMEDFSPVPNGTYSVIIVETEVNPTAAETGHYLSIKMQICDHTEMDGRVLFTNLNLDNPSDQAVAIAKKELATICRAAGIVKLDDTDQLHDKVIEVKVVVEKRKGDNEKFDSRIKSYKKVGTAAAEAAEGKTVEAVGATTTNPAPADTPADSWMRKT